MAKRITQSYVRPTGEISKYTPGKRKVMRKRPIDKDMAAPELIDSVLDEFSDELEKQIANGIGENPEYAPLVKLVETLQSMDANRRDMFLGTYYNRLRSVAQCMLHEMGLDGDNMSVMELHGIINAGLGFGRGPGTVIDKEFEEKEGN